MNSCVDVFDSIPVYGIPTVHVDDVWLEARPIIEKAVFDDTDETIDTVYAELLIGNYHLWIIGNYDAIAVTEIQERPARRVAFIRFIAGKDMKRWFDAWVTALEYYAENEDCKAIEFAGRKGWLKHAEKYTAYKPTRTIFRREL